MVPQTCNLHNEIMYIFTQIGNWQFNYYYRTKQCSCQQRKSELQKMCPTKSSNEKSFSHLFVFQIICMDGVSEVWFLNRHSIKNCCSEWKKKKTIVSPAIKNQLIY